MDQIIERITLLKPSPGDVLIVKVSPAESKEAVEALAEDFESLLEAAECEATVLLTPIEFDVQTLNVKQMADLGWQRIPGSWGKKKNRVAA